MNGDWGDLRQMSGFMDQPGSGKTGPGGVAGARTVCVIGGGFSGTMVVANLVRVMHEGGGREEGSDGGVRVVMIDDREEPCAGVAYGTRDPEHLLNVPAGRMSAWADRPDDFLEFARGEDERVKPGDFVARVVYGRYLKETLRREIEKGRVAGAGVSVEVVKDRVIEVREASAESGERADRGGARWVVRTESGREVRTRAVVLTIGHRPPMDPLLGKWKGSRERWIGDPWSSREMARIGRDDDVVILGTGLTAVDVMATLTREGSGGTGARRGRIVCVSRRGMLPRAHLGVPVAARDMSLLLGAMIAEKQVAVRRVLAVVREQLAEPGVDWRSVIDGLRPLTQRLWAGLNERERRRFMGKVRPLWEVHRHRMAPRMAERIEGLLVRGMVRLVAGRVESADGGPAGVELRVGLRGGGSEVVRGAWVINCTGPTADSRGGGGGGSHGGEAAHPVVASLIARGHLVADGLGLGVLTGERGEARDARGELRADLLVVGTLRKPDLWESTAVPELRVQAGVAAKRVLSDA